MIHKLVITKNTTLIDIIIDIYSRLELAILIPLNGILIKMGDTIPYSQFSAYSILNVFRN